MMQITASWIHAVVNKYRADLSIKGQQLMEEEIERGEYGTIILQRGDRVWKKG